MSEELRFVPVRSGGQTWVRDGRVTWTAGRRKRFVPGCPQHLQKAPGPLAQGWKSRIVTGGPALSGWRRRGGREKEMGV